MNSTIHCLDCFTASIIKNGHFTHTGKQQFLCKDCSKYFVEQGQEWFISEKERKMVDRLFLEKISLRVPHWGAYRVMQVSLIWLMNYVNAKYTRLSDGLFYRLPLETKREISIYRSVWYLCRLKRCGLLSNENGIKFGFGS